MTNLAELAGQRAIIVGGSRGIGLAIARHLSKQSVRVTIAARDTERLSAARAELSSDGLDVDIASLDIRDPISVQESLERSIAKLGGVEILINTAAIPADQIKRLPLEEFDEADLRAQLETKLFGFLRTIRAVAPYMKKNGYGRIVNIGGQSAFQTGSVSATVRSLALQGLTSNLADELGPFGITVNVVHPGFTVTERTPEIASKQSGKEGITPDKVLEKIALQNRNQRLNTADEIASFVSYVASPLGVVVNGESIYAGGGLRGRAG